MAKKKEETGKKIATGKKEVIGYIKTKKGKKYEVTNETNRYWICKNTQFRKANEKVTFEKRKEND
jgi:hypothetical protein